MHRGDLLGCSLGPRRTRKSACFSQTMTKYVPTAAAQVTASQTVAVRMAPTLTVVSANGRAEERLSPLVWTRQWTTMRLLDSGKATLGDQVRGNRSVLSQSCWSTSSQPPIVDLRGGREETIMVTEHCPDYAPDIDVEPSWQERVPTPARSSM